jgi:hypothetical protein
MNFRLIIASLMIRGRGQVKWLRMVDTAVTEALVSSIGDEQRVAVIIALEMPGDPGRFRAEMSRKHAQLVNELSSMKGDEGIAQVKEELFATGARLGAEVRNQLKLSDEPEQLIAAAKLLYRILDIDFDVDADGKGMRVSRCSLADNYGPFVCGVISRMDEGVVHGLNPRASMRFSRRNCPEATMCQADIIWDGGR